MPEFRVTDHYKWLVAKIGATYARGYEWKPSENRPSENDTLSYIIKAAK